MPTLLVDALTAPIREVQSLVGPGWTDDPTGDPGTVLREVREALADLSAAGGRAWNQAEASWWGAGADGAAEFAAQTVATTDALATRIGDRGTTVDAASAAVARANERLQAIIDRFEARATALEPHLDSPGVAEEMLEEARRSLAEAVGVVDELQAELDSHAAALAGPTPSSPPATVPAGLTSPSAPAMGSGMGGGMPTSPLAGAAGAPGSGLGELASLVAPHDPRELPEASTFGTGVAVRLPDGSTAMAPNAVAASAVRHALTQLGVPYQWGGTAPGWASTAAVSPSGRITKRA